jgi:hypothetical protein
MEPHGANCILNSVSLESLLLILQEIAKKKRKEDAGFVY